MLHEKSGKKGHEPILVKWLEMLLLALKTITCYKMRWEWVNTVSGIIHTHFHGSAQEK